MKKKPNRLAQILVLSFFLFLITGFVAYRSGYFERAGASEISHPSIATDTIPSILIVTDSTPKPRIQTTLEKTKLGWQRRKSRDSITKAERLLMSGSKSIIVVENKKPLQYFSGSKSGQLIPINYDKIYFEQKMDSQLKKIKDSLATKPQN